jgi:hypothetical protein
MNEMKEVIRAKMPSARFSVYFDYIKIWSVLIDAADSRFEVIKATKQL